MVTALYTGILGILLIILSALVIRGRFKYQAGVGDNGNEAMQRCIRVQGNFVEYVPVAILLMMMCEMSGTQAQTIHYLGIGLVVSRILHAVGLTCSSGPTPPRFLGTIGTFLLILIMSTMLIMNYFSPVSPAMP